VHIDVTICWQVWTGTSEEIALPASKGCHNAALREQQFNSLAVHVQLCVEMVQVTDESEELLSLFIIIKDKTSVVITILRWCCTWTQNILPHCTASSRSS
jgi:hypothetical protein